MSPRLPVANLSVLSKRSVIDLTLDAAKCWGEECIRPFRNYYRKLPGRLKEAIVSDILDQAVLGSFTKWVGFRMFDCECSRFDSRQLSPKYHEKFAEDLRNVSYLNLTHAKISEAGLLKILENSIDLRALVIPDLATDDVLKRIKHLRSLELLDISGGGRFTPGGLEHLSSDSIKVLSIGYPLTHVIGQRDTCEMIFYILLRLPNLKELRTYRNIGRVVLGVPLPYVSNLKVISDYDTGLRQMEAIVAVCPLLQELSLEDPEKKSLSVLEESRYLRTLKVSRALRDRVTLRKLTLTTLQLNNAIIYADDLCLTLEHLILISCEIRSFENGNFRNLRTVEFVDCDANKTHVLNLLYHCDYIQRLALSSEVHLADEEMKDLCAKRKLRHLEQLWLSLAKRLTIDTVILLMNHCDKLTELGTLNGWDVDRVEVNYLRCLVQLSNLKLTFLYFRCF